MERAEVSVRERHRRETLSSIHMVAKQRAFAYGLADVKIDDIASAVGISRRTFFNYFPTKEDAVLGLQAPCLPDGAAERFMNSADDLLTRIVWLVVEVMKTSAVEGSTLEDRRILRRRFPVLNEQLDVRMTDAKAIILPVVTMASTEGDEPITEEELRALLGVAGIVLRTAYQLDHIGEHDAILESLQILKSTIRKVL